MLYDEYILTIYFDVGCRRYKYYDYDQLIFDLKGDLYYLVKMCKYFRVQRFIQIKEDEK